jgi:hypothetical protein
VSSDGLCPDAGVDHFLVNVRYDFDSCVVSPLLSLCLLKKVYIVSHLLSVCLL